MAFYWKKYGEPKSLCKDTSLSRNYSDMGIYGSSLKELHRGVGVAILKENA